MTSTQIPRSRGSGLRRCKHPRNNLYGSTGHMPMTEEPEKFVVSLVRFVRPIAEKVGDAAP